MDCQPSAQIDNIAIYIYILYTAVDGAEILFGNFNV